MRVLLNEQSLTLVLFGFCFCLKHLDKNITTTWNDHFANWPEILRKLSPYKSVSYHAATWLLS